MPGWECRLAGLAPPRRIRVRVGRLPQRRPSGAWIVRLGVGNLGEQQEQAALVQPRGLGRFGLVPRFPDQAGR